MSTDKRHKRRNRRLMAVMYLCGIGILTCGAFDLLVATSAAVHGLLIAIAIGLSALFYWTLQGKIDMDRRKTNG